METETKSTIRKYTIPLTGLVGIAMGIMAAGGVEEIATKRAAKFMVVGAIIGLGVGYLIKSSKKDQ